MDDSLRAILLHVAATAATPARFLKPEVANGANFGNGRKIPIPMDKKRIVLVGELRYAAVDGAAKGLSAPAQIKIDPGGVSPRLGIRLKIVLMLKVGGENAPFLLVTRPLQ